jgi:hypothetical protein
LRRSRQPILTAVVASPVRRGHAGGGKPGSMDRVRGLTLPRIRPRRGRGTTVPRPSHMGISIDNSSRVKPSYGRLSTCLDSFAESARSFPQSRLSRDVAGKSSPVVAQFICRPCDRFEFCR